MLANITYGTFLLFGSCCIMMGFYTIFCVPETKGIPLESIGRLFEGSIVKGCVQDTFPSKSRANKWKHQAVVEDEDEYGVPGKKGARVEHVENV